MQLLRSLLWLELLQTVSIMLLVFSVRVCVELAVILHLIADVLVLAAAVVIVVFAGLGVLSLLFLLSQLWLHEDRIVPPGQSTAFEKVRSAIVVFRSTVAVANKLLLLLMFLLL